MWQAARHRNEDVTMSITSLNHINIRTDLMEETKDFYVDIVGLSVGFRPDFDDHGYWLYADDTATVGFAEPSRSGAVTAA